MADFRLFGDDNASVASLGVMLEGLGKPLHDVDVSGGGGGGTNLGAIQTDPNDVIVTSDTGGDATLVPATVSDAGVMSAADKTKLDSVPADVGDVDGPASSVDSNFALFAGTTGKNLKDGGVKASDFDATGTAAVVQGNLNTHEADQDNPHQVNATDVGVDTDALVPSGGVANEVLTKLSGTDFDDAWAEPPITPVGGANLDYVFSTTITATDPGAGNLRFNSANQEAATFIYVSATTRHGNPAIPVISGLRIEDFVAVAEAKNGLRGGYYELTSAPVDNTGWFSLAVVFIPNNDFLPVRSGTNIIMGLVDNPRSALPPGGATGEVLTKVSNDDYDTDWTAAGAGGGYDTVQDEGTPLIQRSTMNFTGAGVVASDDGFVTTVDISSGGGGANLSAVQADPNDFVIASDSGTNATVVPATGSIAGGMSSTDKSKLDGIEPGAQVRRTLENNGTPLSDEATVDYRQSILAADVGPEIAISLEGDVTSPGNNQVYGTDGAGAKGWKSDPAGGSGDVVGPVSAVDNNFALFDGATGKLISDDGVKASDFDEAGAAGVVQGNLNSHEADLANPHAVTAAQAGADPVGSASTVQGNLNTHEADLANPHAVTAAQAGADPAGSAAGVQGNLDTHEGAVNPHTSSVGTLQEGAVGSFVNNVLALTQVQYNGLTPVATTLYLITDAP